MISSLLDYLISHLNGFYYKMAFALLKKGKVTIGKNFRVRGKLSIKGPGSVIFGNDVMIDGRGHPVTPFTHSRTAVIRIGDHSFINGTRFGCHDEIAIGPYAILGDARILDTDFHSIEIDRWSENARVLHSPIRIGRNVWIGGGTIILKGICIGDNSVIGMGSVVTANVPANSVAAGNPAKVVKTLAFSDT